MKTILDDLIANLKRIKPETVYARSVSTEALDEAANANRDQLEKGTLSDGAILPPYAKNTVLDTWKIRTRKVNDTEKISFKDTGDFHKSIKAQVNTKGDLTLKATSQSYKKVKEFIEFRTNSDENAALGLTPENLKSWYKFFVDAEFKKALFNRIRYGQ